MIKSLLIYIAVAVGSTAFFVMFRDLISLILLCVVLATPVVLFLIHLISFFCTKIDISCDDSVVNTSVGARVVVRVKSFSPFAVTAIKLSARCRNLFLNTEYDCRFVVYSRPFRVKEFVYELRSDHIGNIEIKIKKAVFCDFFSMFRLTKRIRLSKIVTVLPKPVGVTATLRPNNYFTSEADTFSPTKAGEDPSEVFNIRDFMEGDRLNKIHWKLTTKIGHYMVKEYSLPVSEAVIIYADLMRNPVGEPYEREDGLHLVDSLIKSLMSVSTYLVETGVVHYISWYDARNETYKKVKIRGAEDVHISLRRLLSDTVFEEMPKLEKCDLFMRRKYSHIIMMTADSPGDLVAQFSGFDISISNLSVLAVGEEGADITPVGGDTQTAYIPVIPEKEAACLHNIKF